MVFDYEADTLVAVSPICCKDGVAAAIKEYFDCLSHVADDGGIHSKDLLSFQLTTRKLFPKVNSFLVSRP